MVGIGKEAPVERRHPDHQVMINQAQDEVKPKTGKFKIVDDIHFNCRVCLYQRLLERQGSLPVPAAETHRQDQNALGFCHADQLPPH